MDPVRRPRSLSVTRRLALCVFAHHDVAHAASHGVFKVDGVRAVGGDRCETICSGTPATSMCAAKSVPQRVQTDTVHSQSLGCL
jgi:hypothetical protein